MRTLLLLTALLLTLCPTHAQPYGSVRVNTTRFTTVPFYTDHTGPVDRSISISTLRDPASRSARSLDDICSRP